MALKLLEGTIAELLDAAARGDLGATSSGKLGGLLIRPAARRIRARLDPDTYGGAYLLGLRGLAVIAHGNSGRRAIANAIELAARGAEHRIVERLAERLPERVRRDEAGTRAARRLDHPGPLCMIGPLSNPVTTRSMR